MPSQQPVYNVLYLTPGHHVLACKTSAEANSPQYNTVAILQESDERCRHKGRLDLLKSMETAVEMIENKNVDIVIGISDNFALLQAALVDMYPHKFRGPSLLSNFLTMDKYYSRLLLDPPKALVPFHHIEISRPLSQWDQEKALSTVGLPAIVKPRTGTRSTFLHKITWEGELLQYVESIRGNITRKIDDIRPFLTRYLPASASINLPLAFEEGLLVEQFVDTPLKASADGLIFNKEIIHWAITDWRYWPSRPEVPQMLLLPSQLPNDVQQRVWDVYDHVATTLIQRGYNNTFFNIQFFICPNGEVKIIEVNGRGSMVQCFCFREVLAHGDMVEAHLKLARGIRPPEPVFTSKHAAYVYFQSMISGRAGDIVDYSVAKSTPYCIIRLKPDDVIEPLGDEGARIGQTTLIGDSRESILRQHQKLYQNLFKKNLLGFLKEQ